MGAADARAIHHSIEPAEAIDGGLSGALARLGARDVARYAGIRGIQIGDQDVGAGCGKLGADFGADAAGPAEDEDHFACALLHDYL